MILDYLAYGILATLYIFTVLPLVGKQEGMYFNAMKLGALFHIFIVVIIGIGFSIFWAWGRVLS